MVEEVPDFLKDFPHRYIFPSLHGEPGGLPAFTIDTIQ
jgi:hypothetical protein